MKNLPPSFIEFGVELRNMRDTVERMAREGSTPEERKAYVASEWKRLGEKYTRDYIRGKRN